MRDRRPILTRFYVGCAVVLACACSNVLGIRDTSEQPLGTPGNPLDSGARPQCETKIDCPIADTVPANCAETICSQNVCLYLSKDADLDGERTAHCVSKNKLKIELGLDCDDTNASLSSQKSIDCDTTPTGQKVIYPGGVPRGACKLGKISCKPDGTVSKCEGATGPSTEKCDIENVDEDCDGDSLNGCPCDSPGLTRPCGTSAKPPCALGTSTCVLVSWAACAGNVEPKARDCMSPADNNCDGKPDNTEDAVCACPAGTSRPCNTHPGKDGIGTCKPGTQSCVGTPGASGNSSTSWGACAGDVGPAQDDCSINGRDADCDGIKGNAAACTRSLGGGCKVFVNADAETMPVWWCSTGDPVSAVAFYSTDYNCNNSASMPYAWNQGCGPGMLACPAGYVKKVSGGTGWITASTSCGGTVGGFTLP